MKHTDMVNFNGRDITIADLYKKSNKEIIIGLYCKTKEIEDKIKGIPEQVSKNGRTIAYIKGVLAVLIAITVGIGLKLFI